MSSINARMTTFYRPVNFQLKLLPPASFMISNVVLYGRSAAGEPILIPETFENALGRVTLLGVPAQVILLP